MRLGHSSAKKLVKYSHLTASLASYLSTLHQLGYTCVFLPLPKWSLCNQCSLSVCLCAGLL